MQITVRGKNIEITNSLRDHVEKKVGKLEKYFNVPLTAQTTLSVEKDRHIVEVTIFVNGIILRGEEETGDMYASIDLVLDKLEKQIEKYKTRISRKLKHDSKTEALTEMVKEEGADLEKPLIVKTKKFAMKPMSVEEAVMQMNLIGHDFFVFADAETQKVSVVYRRKDGNYGLIEPGF